MLALLARRGRLGGRGAWLQRSSSTHAPSGVRDGGGGAKRRRRRLRQHVNPLTQASQRVAVAPAWASAFADAGLPLHLDIGCARGAFAVELAARLRDSGRSGNVLGNVLGLEIREAAASEAQAAAHPHENLHVICCNAATSLEPLLRTYPGPVAAAYILHPDPWWKKRHRKRRLVNREFTATLARVVPPGGQLLLQTDVEGLMEEMASTVRASGAWWVSAGATCAKEYSGIATAREAYVRREGGDVFGELFARTEAAMATDRPPLSGVITPAETISDHN